MLLTINSTPESAAFLQHEAERRGVEMKQLAAEIFAEAIEDLEDVETAEEILAQTDPKQWRTLDELRKVVRGEVVPDSY